MIDFKNIKALVKTILELDEQARNSDSFLYFRVLDIIAKKKNIDIRSMSVVTFLLRQSEYGFPPFETVRRCRQRIQQFHPELAASKKVEKMRDENEKKYRAFAKAVEV